MRHPRKSLLFALLGGADFLLTWWLLQTNDGLISEANPLAQSCLAHFGWAGLAVYKILSTVVFGTLAMVISWYRPEGAGKLLWFGCTTQAVVVGYSLVLITVSAGLAQEDAAEHARLIAEDQQLDQRVRNMHVYETLVDQSVRDLVAHRCSLAEVVRQLAGTERGRSQEWQGLLQRHFPGRSVMECLAANLMEAIRVSLRGRPEVAQQALRRLAREFRWTYGSAPPLMLADVMAKAPSITPLARSGHALRARSCSRS